MSTTYDQSGRLTSGFVGAVALHVAAAAALVAVALLHPPTDHWGDKASQVGAIQASMVSAIPLPQKAPPVDKAVLTPDDVSPAPVPPPKEATQPPPKPTDILIKGKTATKVAPITAPAPPKHPQPTPYSKKAQSGESAMQLPQSITQLKNGTAAATIEDKAFGDRFAYYRDIVSRRVSENWYTAEADPRSSQGKHVVLLIDIQRDGSPTNIRIETKSGSPSLDASAVHALQRIDSFGQLPSGNSVTVELSFDYHQP